MGRTPMSGGPAFRFMASEVVDMEKALDASSGATPARSVVEALADKFTNSTERAGQKPVQWKQVWNWFQNRRHALKGKNAKTPDKLKAVGSGGENTTVIKAVAATAPSTGKKSDGLMDFEAKSGRDGAWYDVSALISKRTGEDGALEVRVRFAGFGSEEDEWVNITTAVRQRSLPCEATECVAVLPGDLILCFQEGHEQALYFDADILDVQRRRHDVRGCRCRFWVRYVHDQTEEVVPLRKVCRRPETEQRLQAAREAGASSSKTANKSPPSDKALNVIPINSVKPQIFPTTPAIPAAPAQSIVMFDTPTLTTNAPQDPRAVHQSATPEGTTPVQLSSIKHTQIPVHSISTLQEATPAQPVATNQELAPVEPGATPSTDVAQAQSSPALLQPKDAIVDASTAAQGMNVTPETRVNVDTPTVAASEAPTSINVNVGATEEPASAQASAPPESAPVEAPAELSKPMADTGATGPSETAQEPGALQVQ